MHETIIPSEGAAKSGARSLTMASLATTKQPKGLNLKNWDHMEPKQGTRKVFPGTVVQSSRGTQGAMDLSLVRKNLLTPIKQLLFGSMYRIQYSQSVPLCAVVREVSFNQNFRKSGLP